jgi:hypothetical protein
VLDAEEAAKLSRDALAVFDEAAFHREGFISVRAMGDAIGVKLYSPDRPSGGDNPSNLPAGRFGPSEYPRSGDLVVKQRLSALDTHPELLCCHGASATDTISGRKADASTLGAGIRRIARRMRKMDDSSL